MSRRLPRTHARRWGAAALVAVVLAAALVSLSAAHAGSPRAAATLPPGQRGLRPFSEQRAFDVVKLQLSYGPRPAGTAAQRRAADALVHMLPGGHFESVPGNLRNIVGSLPGREPAIVLGAHYDTTPVPGYLGANNSATGVAAVIELARALASDPARRNEAAVRFVLFDGEEAPAGFTDFVAQGLRGSRAYVAAHAATSREFVLLDFIALRHERLPREQGSNSALWSRLRTAALQTGHGSLFPAATAPQVFDDHTPFAQAGIPAVDLIDFDYPCWQKVCDDLSQVSQPSLAAVGASVLALLRAERQRAQRPGS